MTKEEAIECLELLLGFYSIHDGYTDKAKKAIKMAIKTLKEPKCKKGKWIDDGTELGCCCSECGATLDDYFYGDLYDVYLGKMPNFCPNCGRAMEQWRGKEND